MHEDAPHHAALCCRAFGRAVATQADVSDNLKSSISGLAHSPRRKFSMLQPVWGEVFECRDAFFGKRLFGASLRICAEGLKPARFWLRYRQHRSPVGDRGISRISRNIYWVRREGRGCVAAHQARRADHVRGRGEGESLQYNDS